MGTRDRHGTRLLRQIRECNVSPARPVSLPLRMLPLPLSCPIYMAHPFCFHNHSYCTSPAMRSRLPDPTCPAFLAPASHLTGLTSSCLPSSRIPPTVHVLPPLPDSPHSPAPHVLPLPFVFCAPLLADSCASCTCTFSVSLKVC